MPSVDLPRRRFGGVDRAAAQAAIDEQRRIVADLNVPLAVNLAFGPTWADAKS